MIGFADLLFASLVSLTPSGALRAGELTKAFESLAEQALVLAAASGLLGLGLGTSLFGAGVYLVKRRQIRRKLQA